MPNNEYINKITACNEINRFTGYLDDDMICRLQIALNRIPAADVEPKRKTGRWLDYDDTERFIARCSLCGDVVDTRLSMNYCPNCGAKMNKE